MSDASGGGGPTYPGYPGQPQPSAGTSPPPAQAYLPPPGQGAPGGYPGYPGGGYSDDGPRGWSRWAVAAFIVGLVIPLIGILVAIPLGIVALVKIGRGRQRGKVLAILGMVFSVLWWVGLIALGVWAVSQQAGRDDTGAISKSGRIAFGDIREGDCVSIPGLTGTEDIDTFKLKGVPCSQPHNAETVAVIRIDSSDYPGQANLDDQSGQPCRDAISAVPAIQAGGYQSSRLIPTEGIWGDPSGHRVLCFVVKSGFGNFTGSLIP